MTVMYLLWPKHISSLIKQIPNPPSINNEGNVPVVPTPAEVEEVLAAGFSTKEGNGCLLKVPVLHFVIVCGIYLV